MDIRLTYSSTSLQDSVDLMNTPEYFVTQHSFKQTKGKESILDFVLCIPASSSGELGAKIAYINQMIDGARHAGPPNYMGQPLVLWTKFGNESSYSIWTVLSGITAPIDLGVKNVYELHLRLKLLPHTIGEQYSISGLVVQSNQTIFVSRVRGIFPAITRMNIPGNFAKAHIGVRGHALLQQNDFNPKYLINASANSADLTKLATIYGHGGKFDFGMAELFLDVTDNTPFTPDATDLDYVLGSGQLKGGFYEYGQTGNDSALSNLVDVQIPGAPKLDLPLPSFYALGGICTNPGTYSIDRPSYANNLSFDLESDGWVLSEEITSPLIVKNNPLYGNANPTNKLPPKSNELGYCQSIVEYPLPPSKSLQRSVQVTMNISSFVLGSLSSPAFFPILGNSGILFNGLGWRLYCGQSSNPVEEWKSKKLVTSPFLGMALNSDVSVGLEMSWIFGSTNCKLFLGGNEVSTVFINGNPNKQNVVLGCFLSNELPEYTFDRVVDLDASTWQFTKVSISNTTDSISVSMSNSESSSTDSSESNSSSTSFSQGDSESHSRGDSGQEGYSIGFGKASSLGETSTDSKNISDNTSESESKSYTILKNVPTITTSKQSWQYNPVQVGDHTDFVFGSLPFTVSVSYNDVKVIPDNGNVTFNIGANNSGSDSFSASGSAENNVSDSTDVGSSSSDSLSSSESTSKSSSSSQSITNGSNNSNSSSSSTNKSSSFTIEDNSLDIPLASYTREVMHVGTVSTITISTTQSTSISTSNTQSGSTSFSSSSSDSLSNSTNSSDSYSEGHSTATTSSLNKAKQKNVGESDNASTSSNSSDSGQGDNGTKDTEFGKVSVDTTGQSSVDVQSSFDGAVSSDFNQTRTTNPPSPYWRGGPDITGSHTEHTIEDSWDFDPFHNPLSLGIKFDKTGAPNYAMSKVIWPGQNNSPRYDVFVPNSPDSQIVVHHSLIDAGTVIGFPDSDIEHSESETNGRNNSSSVTHNDGTNSSTSSASNSSNSHNSSDSTSSSLGISTSNSTSQSNSGSQSLGQSFSSNNSTSSSTSIQKQDVYRTRPLIETIVPNMAPNLARTTFSFKNLSVYDGPLDGLGSSVILSWTRQPNLTKQRIYRRSYGVWQYVDLNPSLSSFVDDGTISWTLGNPNLVSMEPGLFKAVVNGIIETRIVRANGTRSYVNLGPVMLSPTPSQLALNTNWSIDIYGAGNVQVNSLFTMPFNTSRMEVSDSPNIIQTNRYEASSDVGTLELESGQDIIVVLAEDNNGVPLDLDGTIISLDITPQSEYINAS